LRNTVFDASALICLVRKERGWEKVASFGVDALISAVNLVEVAYSLKKHGMPLDAIDAVVRPVIGRIVPFNDQHAYLAAVIHGQTQKTNVSLADCACLALGMSEKATVVTADKVWQKLGLDVKIVQIR
jgi:ribonuclease VapC